MIKTPIFLPQKKTNSDVIRHGNQWKRFNITIMIIVINHPYIILYYIILYYIILYYIILYYIILYYIILYYIILYYIYIILYYIILYYIILYYIILYSADVIHVTRSEENIRLQSMDWKIIVTNPVRSLRGGNGLVFMIDLRVFQDKETWQIFQKKNAIFKNYYNLNLRSVYISSTC